jgi:membrane-associated protease RseP (regulator of RpoE activity)
MTALYYTLGVVIFTVAILVSIGLHELGHMIPAKKFGRKVSQYFVGFGRTVWSTKRGETEYGIKAIPLGGYVKIVGMLPPDEKGHLRQTNTGMFTQLVADARAAEWELVEEGDEDRLFYKMPWWKKVIVMAGGPSVNIAIAFLIFAGLFATYGNLNDPVRTPVVTEVSACVVPYEEADRACTPEELRTAQTPAADAGIEVGDEIIGFNGTAVESWEQLTRLIRDNEDGAATIVVRRDGRELTLRTSTLVTPRPTSLTDETLKPVGFLGVSPSVHLRTGGLGYTLGQMGQMTMTTLNALVDLPAKVYDVGQAIVGLEERDPQGPVSIVGGGRIAGETAAHEVFPVKEKAVLLLMLIAAFNFFIGMFNFVPLLPLDGGHIAGALYEALRRGWARLRRRPDPGYVDVARLLPVAYVMAGVLLIMGMVLIVGDIVVPISFYS